MRNAGSSLLLKVALLNIRSWYIAVQTSLNSKTVNFVIAVKYKVCQNFMCIGDGDAFSFSVNWKKLYHLQE